MTATIWPAERRGLDVVVVVHARCHSLDCLLDGSGAARHDDGPRSNQLLDAERRERSATKASTSASLPLTSAMTASGETSSTRPRRQLDELEHVRAIRLGDADLHERELVLDGRLGGDVLDLEHVDQPVQLLRRLLDRDVVAVEADRHPREALAIGAADGERVDVEVPRAHQAGHAVQDTRLVDDDRDEPMEPLLATAGQRPRRRRGVRGRAAARAVRSAVESAALTRRSPTPR